MRLVIAVSVTVLLAMVLRHYQLRFAVSNYIAELKAKGEPMDLAQLLPPPIPADQNAVPYISNSLTNQQSIINRINSYPQIAMRRVAPGKAIVGWQQPGIYYSPRTNSYGPITNSIRSRAKHFITESNSWEDLGRDLTAVKGSLDDFQQLTNHPDLDFQVDYNNPWFNLYHLDPLRNTARWLNAAVIYDLHEGNPSSAIARLREILAIVKGMTEERFGISQSTRVAIAGGDGLRATWEILQHPGVSESELGLLQADWQELGFALPALRAQLMDRWLLIPTVERLRDGDSDKLWGEVIGNQSGPQRMFTKYVWKWYSSYVDEDRALHIFQVIIEASRVGYTNRSYQSALSFYTTNSAYMGFGKFKNETGLQIDIDENDVKNLLTEGAFKSFARLRSRYVVETERSLVITAIALKRYELRNHHLPGSLQALTPVFLESVPVDWMDGQPLRYRLNADGTFVLYSVGENGIDDGGNPSLDYNWLSPNGPDWVWPQGVTNEPVGDGKIPK